MQKIKTINELIEKGEFREALILSRNLAEERKDKNSLKELTLLLARHEELLKEVRNNVISNENRWIEKAKLYQSLVEILEKIAETPFYDKRKLLNLIEKTHSKRTEIIANESKELFEIYGGGVIRQRAVYSSFSIPNRGENEFVWRNLASKHKDQLKNERLWLERHVLNKYCKLIIKPMAVSRLRSKNPKELLVRLQILDEFLKTNLANVDVVTIPEKVLYGRKHLTIVGNWFFAESNDPRSKGWENTSISSKEVDLKIKEFDSEFDQLLERKGISVFDAKQEALSEIDSMIKILKQKK